MNIIMISGDTAAASGQQGAFYNTLNEFSRYWDRVDVIIPRVSSVRNFANVFFHPSTSPKFLHSLFIAQYGERLGKQHKYDLIVSHDYGFFLNGIGAMMLSQKIDVPYVSEIHHVDGYPRAATWRDHLQPTLSQLYIRGFSRRAIAFRITNNLELAPLLRRWGVPLKKILLLHSLYLDLNIFNPTLSSKDYDAIFVGRMSHNKAPFLFLDSLLAAKPFRPIRAVMVGRGELLQKVKDYAKQIRLTVDFIDWVESPTDLANLYRRSKCLICTSYSEGGPRVVAEALACGTPVISTRIGMAQELIRDNENGFLCDWNAREIGERLSQIISEDVTHLRLSANAPHAVQQFEKTKVIREYAAGYQRLVAK